jgi:hypothetical protein
MDPVQQLIVKINSVNAQAKRYATLQQSASNNVASAYSTIASVHLSTSAGLTASLQSLVLANLSSSKVDGVAQGTTNSN